MSAALKIELRNVQHAAFASHETNCFEASVYINGKREGTARNDGTGGCTFVEPRALEEKLEAYARTLPQVEADLGTGEKFSYPQSAETLIDDALEDALAQKDLKRLVASHIAFVADDGTIRQTKKASAAQIAKWLGSDATFAALRTTRDRVLNLMEPERALAVYRGAAQ